MPIGTLLKKYRREVAHRIHLNRPREVALLRRWLIEQPGCCLLDVGCGDGYCTRQLAEAAHQTVGLDINRQEIERAQSFYASPRLNFITGDASRLPFPDGSFDRAVCLCALQNLPDVPAALAELRRVMQPGGWLGLSVDSLLAPEWVNADYRGYHQERFHTSRQFDLAGLTSDLQAAGFQARRQRFLLRSRFAAFWLCQPECWDWKINYWFPLSLPLSWLADALTPPDMPGMILIMLAQRTE